METITMRESLTLTIGVASFEIPLDGSISCDDIDAACAVLKKNRYKFPIVRSKPEAANSAAVSKTVVPMKDDPGPQRQISTDEDKLV
jgi:hypothetical protein